MKSKQLRKKQNKAAKKIVRVIENRRARFDYKLEGELVVGMELEGPMVRAIRDGKIDLKGSFVTVSPKMELWLNNASMTLKVNEPNKSQSAIFSDRIRLLANKKEIFALTKAKNSGQTIVPLKVLQGGRYIKLVIAIGTGKKSFDKRETIKKRDLDRENKRGLE